MRVAIDDLAGFRQDEISAGAFEELAAQAAFQGPQLAADRGLRQAQLGAARAIEPSSATVQK